MIYLSKESGYIDPRVTQSILENSLELSPIYLDLDLINYYIALVSSRIAKNLKALSSVTGRSMNEATWKDTFKKYILDQVPDDLVVWGKTGISISKPSLEKISASIDTPNAEEIKRAIDIHLQISTDKTNRRSLLGYSQLPISDELSRLNHTLVEARPNWSRQLTGRLGMSNPAIQNIAREYQNIVTCPQGYHILHADSGQIEPRITYSWIIKDPQIESYILRYNDSYFGLLHYCLQSEEDLKSGRLDLPLMEITDDLREKRARLKTYTNGVMYGSTSNTEKDPLKDAFINRVGNHKERLKYTDNLLRQLEAGVTKFPTYFGRLIDIYESAKMQEYDLYESYDDSLAGQFNSIAGKNKMHQLLKLAINAPIQGTAADFMGHSVSAVSNLIMSKGCFKSSIACYIHDAGIFYIADDEEDKLLDDLKGMLSYQVEGWKIPIPCDFEYDDEITGWKRVEF